MTPPHLHPSNDAAPLGTRDMFRLSVLLPEPEVVKAQLDRSPCSIAWDEAASCLMRNDFAGFDAALRIFRRLGK